TNMWSPIALFAILHMFNDHFLFVVVEVKTRGFIHILVAVGGIYRITLSLSFLPLVAVNLYWSLLKMLTHECHNHITSTGKRTELHDMGEKIISGAQILTHAGSTLMNLDHVGIDLHQVNFERHAKNIYVFSSS
ncbi:hypothetical protein ACJX0J_032144, partial [Zea mays]